MRAYFLALQYWLSGSDANVVNLVRLLVDRYAEGPRRALRGTLKAAPPVHYPELGVYHPRMAGRMAEQASKLPKVAGGRGTVGLLVMRSYLLAGNTAHYDGVIAALEARGLNVIPAFFRRARRPPGGRRLLQARRRAGHRRAGLAHRVLPCGRPRL